MQPVKRNLSQMKGEDDKLGNLGKDTRVGKDLSPAKKKTKLNNVEKNIIPHLPFKIDQNLRCIDQIYFNDDVNNLKHFICIMLGKK